MIRPRSERATAHNVQTVRSTQQRYRQCGASHNVYTVYTPAKRYIWGAAAQQETLLDRICAGAAFVACIALLMFMG